MNYKKLFTLTIIIFFGSLMFVWAENYCLSSFSTKEQSSLNTFYTVFVTKKEYFKSKIIWLDVEMFDTVSEKINNTVKCSWDYNYYYSYYELRSDLENVLNSVFATKYWSWLADSESEQAVKNLQNNLVKVLGLWYDYSKPMKSTQDLNFGVDVNMASDGVVVKANAGISTDGKYDMKNGKFDMNMKLSWNINFTEETTTNKWDFKADLGILKAKDLYVKVNDVDFNASSSDKTDSTLASINTAKLMLKWMIDQIKWKYINITSWNQSNEMNLMLSSANGIKNFWFLSDKPLMKFYKSADGKRYWIFEKSICDIIGKWFSSSAIFWYAGPSDTYNQCKNWLNKAAVQTQWKWYLVLEKTTDTYSVWLTDKFMKEKLPWYEKILYRNQSEISKFTLPLGVNSGSIINYENGKINWWYNDDSSTRIHFEWTLATDKKNINLTITNSDKKLEIAGNLNYEKAWNTNNLSLTLNIKQAGKQVWTLKLTNKEVTEYLESLNIQDPVEAIELQNIMNQFQWLGF